jgi:hypothetical protein
MEVAQYFSNAEKRPNARVVIGEQHVRMYVWRYCDQCGMLHFHRNSRIAQGTLHEAVLDACGKALHH